MVKIKYNHMRVNRFSTERKKGKTDRRFVANMAAVVRESRVMFPDLNIGDFANERGGITICSIINGEDVYVGEANCSMSDNYCKKTGREIAFKRAFNALVDHVGVRAAVDLIHDAA